ncbi:MAG: hypothetical protein PHU25_18930 [Deltaproteobacteria bacterium]|nr:hypothetical protein [Deltaproteobacteria bacterium]
MSRARPRDLENWKGDFFAVDVDAELGKLPGRRFKAAGENAVELVRLAAAFSPTRIDVESRFTFLRVSHDGGPPLPGLASLLRVLYDPERDGEERHRALERLETEHGLGVLAAFAAAPFRARLEWAVDGEPLGFEVASGARPRRVPSDLTRGFAITVRSRRRDPAAERRLVAERCRHSLVPVRLNGERVSRGFRIEGCLLEVELQNARLRGVVGLPAAGDLVRVTTLFHGIAVKEKVRAAEGGLVFHAVVEEKGENLAATMETLGRAAARLYAQLGPRLGELTGQSRSRALDLLFERAARTGDLDLLAGVKAFPRVQGPPLDLAEVRSTARHGRVLAIDPEARAESFDLDGRDALVLGPRERRFLDVVARLDIAAPPRKARSPGLVAMVRERVTSLTERAGRLFGNRAGEPVEDDELTPPERRFLDALRGEVRSGGFALPGEDHPPSIRVVMAVGQKRPWVRMERDGESEYRLARAHPRVDAMVSAFARDAGLLYPALVELADGHDGWANGRAAAQARILEARG